MGLYDELTRVQQRLVDRAINDFRRTYPDEWQGEWQRPHIREQLAQPHVLAELEKPENRAALSGRGRHEKNGHATSRGRA